MDFTRVHEYLGSLSSSEDPILEEMEERASKTGFPIVGRVAGRFLFVLARAIRALKVFELGSGYGYSALWFARAIGEEGEIVLTDYREELLKDAKLYFERSGIRARVKFLKGDAVENFLEHRGPFDIVYSDIEKERYPEIVEPSYERLKVGGLLIADNLLWQGRVFQETEDPGTVGIVEFTKRIYSHPGFESTIVPIRDGFSLSLKVR